MEAIIEKQILGHSFVLVFDELYEKGNILEFPFGPPCTQVLEITHLSNPAFIPDTLVAQMTRETRSDEGKIHTYRKLRIGIVAENFHQNVIDYIQIDDNGGVRVREAEEMCGFINYLYATQK